MKRNFWRFLYLLSVLRLLPHAILMRVSRNRSIIEADLIRWGSVGMGNVPLPSTYSLLFRMLTQYAEYRNLFYYRLGGVRRLVEFLCPPLPTLSIPTRQVGPGLFIQHGFSTIIMAESIGENCWINQQVTIGYTSRGGCPRIGDRVTINAGAKVLGGVTIGSDVVIGANAVVVKDVPSNVTVVGVPAYIIRRNGVKVMERLGERPSGSTTQPPPGGLPAAGKSSWTGTRSKSA